MKKIHEIGKENWGTDGEELEGRKEDIDQNMLHVCRKFKNNLKNKSNFKN